MEALPQAHAPSQDARRALRLARAALRASHHLGAVVDLLSATVRDAEADLAVRLRAAGMLVDLAGTPPEPEPPPPPSLHLHLTPEVWLERVREAVAASRALAEEDRGRRALPEITGGNGKG